MDSIDLMDSEIMEEIVAEEAAKPEDSNKPNRLHQLPLSRIKQLIKLDPEVNLASQEAVFLITKATELFIEHLAKESYTFTQRSKKKTVQKGDVKSSVDAVDAFAFLEGILD